MKSTYKRITTAAIVIISILFTSCNKYLDVKPDKSTSTFTKLSDLQALLDHDIVWSGNSVGVFAIGAGEFYLDDNRLASMPVAFRSAYKWEPKFEYDAWSSSYNIVTVANTVLSELDRIKTGTDAERDFLKGQALFLRAYCFYNLSQIYCKPYSNSADTDLGIVLRLVPDIGYKSVRSTLKETYDRITGDLTEAASLLPDKGSITTRPSKSAAFGMLARTYLAMREYEKAGEFANKYLEIYSTLLDFNTLDTTYNPAFDFTTNPEIAYFSFPESGLIDMEAIVDSSLLKLYGDADLRKSVYFYTNPAGNRVFKGSYDGISGYAEFFGITTNEQYLIRAEYLVRTNKISDAMKDINMLRKFRIKAPEYTDLAATTQKDALNIVLTERRKELVYRGSRWSDIRRLNLEGANISLQRKVAGETFTLPANDKRFVWLIPNEVILLSGIQQNER